MFTKRLLIILLLALPAFAQKDYLTGTEVDQIREVQEPVARIKLYLVFARQRLDQLQSIMAKNRPGRSGEVRQLLEEYIGIIDAIGTVSDDALVRKADLTLAPAAITEGEKKFLDQLQKIRARSPQDLEMYDFDLKEAIATTTENIDLANEDLATRGQEVNAKADKEKKEVDEVNKAERRVLSKAGDNPDGKPNTPPEDTPLRKPPTLYRPGEKPPDK